MSTSERPAGDAAPDKQSQVDQERQSNHPHRARGGFVGGRMMKDTHTPAFVAGVTYPTRGGWYVTVARINNNGTITEGNGCCYWPDGRVCKREDRKGDLLSDAGRNFNHAADRGDMEVGMSDASDIEIFAGVLASRSPHNSDHDQTRAADMLRSLAAKLTEVEAGRNRLHELLHQAKHDRDCFVAGEAAQKARAETAETALTAARAALVTARESAERWDAFWSSERFKMIGSANVDHSDYPNVKPEHIKFSADDWVHFGLEVWDKHPATNDEQGQHGRALLLAYVDAIRALATQAQPICDTCGYQEGYCGQC